MFILINFDGLPSVPNEVGTGWTNTFLGESPGGLTGLVVYSKIAAGDEGGINVGISGISPAERNAWVCYRVRPYDSASAPQYSTGGGGTDATIDPASITASWGADTNLFIAIACWDSNATLVSYPTGYTLGQVTEVANDAAGCGIAVAAMESGNATEDAPEFTISGSQDHQGTTIAVRLTA